MKYCPQCGAEYRPGFDRCPDCNETLVDDPTPKPVAIQERWEKVEREVVFSTGRRIDAEMARGLLEARGIDARIWGGGMGSYRLESAVTEITGVPSPFNSYGVGVPVADVDEARAILVDIEDRPEPVEEPDGEDVAAGTGVLTSLSVRWALVAAALFLLWFVVMVGPPRL